MKLFHLSVRRIATGRWVDRLKERPELDFDYLLEATNVERIRQNISCRKQVGDIDRLHRLWARIQATLGGQAEHGSLEDLAQLWDSFYAEAANIPNRTHPDTPMGAESEARVLRLNGEKKRYDFAPRTAEQLLKSFKLMRSDVGHTCGERAYFFYNQAAMLEWAVVNYACTGLRRAGFEQLVVPDVLPRSVPKKCGLQDDMLYSISGQPQWTLSGTAEMGIASLIEDNVFALAELPKKYFSVSRCFRPEVASGSVSHGLYRVHEFTKVEMFICTANETGQESDQAHQHIVDLQTQLYGQLDLHFRVLDMPSEELGAAAYRKYDIEAWMPGRDVYGEISSASNCTDFQSRRLSTKYESADGSLKFVHTVNGTACAVSRLLIAILEQHQNAGTRVDVPGALLDHLDEFSDYYGNRQPLALSRLRSKNRSVKNRNSIVK